MAAGDLITADGQLEWNGVLLGSGTVYRWLELAGWEDSPGLDRGAVLRPSRHGAWPGQDFAQERIITWDGRLSTSRSAFGAAVTAWRRATRISDSDEDAPLVIRTKGGETHLIYARLTNRRMENGRDAGIGRAEFAVQWTCSDPHRYSVTEHTMVIPEPDAGTGLAYPLVYPLVWGASADSGARLIVNDGDAAVMPTITITGPCTTPSITQIGSGQVIEVDLVLAAGEQLVINVRDGSVLLDGADRLATLTARSVPPEYFTLPAAVDTELAFRAAVLPGGASCTVTWRDTYL